MDNVVHAKRKILPWYYLVRRVGCMLIGLRGRGRFLVPPVVTLTAVPKQRPGGLLCGAQRAPQQRPATQRPGACTTLTASVYVHEVCMYAADSTDVDSRVSVVRPPHTARLCESSHSTVCQQNADHRASRGREAFAVMPVCRCRCRRFGRQRPSLLLWGLLVTNRRAPFEASCLLSTGWKHSVLVIFLNPQR